MKRIKFVLMAVAALMATIAPLGTTSPPRRDLHRDPLLRASGPAPSGALRSWKDRIASVFRNVALATARLRLKGLGLPAIAGSDTVTGARGTGNIAADVQTTDFSKSILELDPNVAPFLVLTKNLGRRDDQVAVAPKYTWFEDEDRPRSDLVNNGAGYAAGATVITVDNGPYHMADDLLYVGRTGELMRVVSVATNDLTVVRGIGSTAAALVDNDELIRTGSAAQEGALDKAARSNNPTEQFNYTQIFRFPMEETETAISTANRVTPHDWDRAHNKGGKEHKKDIEYAALLGQPSIDVTGAHPRRTTGGFDNYALDNITDVGGTMTEQELFDAVRPIFRHTGQSGSRSKLAMAAPLPVDVVAAFARSKLHIVQSEETFGIRIQQLTSPHGILNFVTHWLLGDHATLKNQIWLADVANTGYKYLHGNNGSRDTKLRENIQAPGADTRKDEYLTECGFVFGQSKTHGRIINITG